MGQFGKGQPVRRKEDDRLIVGKGRYTDDIDLPNQAHAFILRSPHANARIGNIDVTAARTAPGVVAVFTGADIRAGGLGVVPCVAPITNRDGSDMANPPRFCLASDQVHYVGEGVAMIVAESLDQARDAAELVEIDYQELPAVGDIAAALRPGAPQVWDHAPGNLVFDWAMGDESGTDEAIRKAAHVTRIELVNNRVIVASMEPRNAIGAYDAEEDRYTLYTGSQGVHSMRKILADATLQIPAEKLRVVTHDVGGGFGMKSYVYPEHGLVLWAAKRIGRPVKWNSGRDEAFVSDTQGRDHVTDAELALDSDGRFLAVRVRTVANLGAYNSQYGPFIPTMAGGGMHVGVYAIPRLYNAVKGVFTNTTPIDAYRGAGRPEACYVIERLVDTAAREMNIPAPELRRRNYIREFPFTTGGGSVYDSGDFERNMNDAMELAEWSTFEARRAEKARRGLLAGIGMAYYVERTGAAPMEFVQIAIGSDETVKVTVGTQTNGQGHETSYAQLVADRLGVPFEKIQVTSGDSDALPGGGGTGGSRSLTMAGGAIGLAAEDVVNQGKAVAADQLEAAEADIEFADGRFTIAGTDRSIGLFDVARIVAEEGNASGLIGDGLFEHSTSTFPNGCHICEVEIERDTGVLRVVRYSVCDDFGTVLNPLLVEGQVHGGVVQGLGQAMGEEAKYDPDSGQLMTGSFMDYWLPRADDMPFFRFKFNEIPCATNPLGVKGCGEAGTIGACPTLVNAVVDALSGFRIQHVDMPVTGPKLWAILREHQMRAAAE